MQFQQASQDLENDVAQLLVDLTRAQEELLQVLRRKRDMMAQCDVEGITQLQSSEEELNARLEQLHERRAQLLQRATNEGLEAETLRELTARLPTAEANDWENRFQNASNKMRLLQHQSLTNWVLAQRSLLHVSQLLEIIATGGRIQPTYGKREPVATSGALVDRAG